MKIEELKTLEQAMTGGEWIEANAHEKITALVNNGPEPVDPPWPDQMLCVMDACADDENHIANIDGICALRNAAPEMLAVVEAACMWKLDWDTPPTEYVYQSRSDVRLFNAVDAFLALGGSK